MKLKEISTAGCYRTINRYGQSIRINYHINTVNIDERWGYLTIRITR